MRLPFTTRVLGVEVTVVALDATGDDHPVAVCARGAERQAIPLESLPLPEPPPEGAEWIEAYRAWIKGGY